MTLIEGVVHPGIAIYSAKMVEKPALDETVCHWHQDDAYSQQQSISACRMSVWIPLSDCDEGNGCLWMVPGSHLQGLQPWSRREDGFCNLAFQHGEESIDGAVPVPIEAGSVLLFHALTWHRSLANRTDQRRHSFIISYQGCAGTRRQWGSTQDSAGSLNSPRDTDLPGSGGSIDDLFDNHVHGCVDRWFATLIIPIGQCCIVSSETGQLPHLE